MFLFQSIMAMDQYIYDNRSFLDIISAILMIFMKIVMAIITVLVVGLIIHFASGKSIAERENAMFVAHHVITAIICLILLFLIVKKTGLRTRNSQESSIPETYCTTSTILFNRKMAEKVLSSTLSKSRSMRHMYIIYFVVFGMGLVICGGLLAYFIIKNKGFYKSIIIILGVLVGIFALILIALAIKAFFDSNPYNINIDDGLPILRQQYNEKESKLTKTGRLLGLT